MFSQKKLFNNNKIFKNIYLDTLVKQLGNFEGYELLRNEKISESLSITNISWYH